MTQNTICTGSWATSSQRTKTLCPRHQPRSTGIAHLTGAVIANERLHAAMPGQRHRLGGRCPRSGRDGGRTAGRGSFLWDGAAATWFWVDPPNDVVFVGMNQRMLSTPGAPNMEDSSRALTYQALIHPEK
jgi:CubicO group peptidase (beta-lactamase class C family)